jgi:putative addiction module component (TIGR02574 family)
VRETSAEETDTGATLQELGTDWLSTEERLALAQRLWHGVAPDLEQQPLTAAQRADVERRVTAADANPGQGIPWEVVRAQARARWKRWALVSSETVLATEGETRCFSTQA